MLTMHRTMTLIALAGSALASVASAQSRPAPDQSAIMQPALAQMPIADRPTIEAVFVVDTTGSMSGLIEAAKQKIWSIASAMASGTPTPSIRVGLLAYRDRGDAYVTSMFELSDDLDTVYSKLLSFEAAGGGDTPESVNQALHEAVTKFAWTPGPNVLRIVYLVGDAPPKTEYQDDVKHDATCTLAVERGIIINTIQCGAMPETAEVWRQIARSAEGEYVAIDQAGGVVVVQTPFDAQLGELGIQLRDTNIPYGDEQTQQRQADKEATAKANDAAVASRPAAAAERVQFLATEAGAASLWGGGELVRDLQAGRANLELIPEAHLPVALQGMTVEQRKDFVQAVGKQREGIVAQITELQTKREAFLKEQAAAQGTKDAFDVSVLDMLRRQARRVGLVYEDQPGNR